MGRSDFAHFVRLVMSLTLFVGEGTRGDQETLSHSLPQYLRKVLSIKKVRKRIKTILEKITLDLKITKFRPKALLSLSIQSENNVP